MGASEKTCIEDPRYAETRKTLLGFDKKFKLYVVFSVVYGLVFINYIDVISGGYEGYHLWLVIMYFFPFATLSMLFPRNLQLTVGLGLVVSLMNDVFYGVVRNVMGFPLDLTWYYNRWLLPGNATLFQLNLGFIVIPVLSWMMALHLCKNHRCLLPAKNMESSSKNQVPKRSTDKKERSPIKVMEKQTPKRLHLIQNSNAPIKHVFTLITKLNKHFFA